MSQFLFVSLWQAALAWAHDRPSGQGAGHVTSSAVMLLLLSLHSPGSPARGTALSSPQLRWVFTFSECNLDNPSRVCAESRPKLCSVGNMGHRTHCGHSHDDLMYLPVLTWDVCVMAVNILADIPRPPQSGERGNSGNSLVTWGVLWKCSCFKS